MLKAKTKLLWKKLRIGVSISFLGGVIATVYLQETIRDFLSTNQLSYEVVSVSKLNKRELSDFAVAERLGFNLSLDDPILSDYFLIMTRLRNEGEAINGPVKFSVSLGTPLAKFLDIKHKVTSPKNKAIPISHSILPLNWNLGVEGDLEFHFAWDDTPQVGFSVYRSAAKDVGFGRITETVLARPSFSVKHQPDNLSTIYYAVSSINCWGESSLSDSVQVSVPVWLATQASFENVVWVDLDAPSSDPQNGSKNSPYSSLSDVFEKSDEPSRTIIVVQNRQELTSYQNLPEDYKVLYMDDLAFLKGRAELTFLTGIDEDANILLYFLFKSGPDTDFDFTLTLEGSPDVRFNRLDDGNSSYKNVPEPKPKKLSLTPLRAAAYLGDQIVYIVWEPPEESDYEGVRIFRSPRQAFDESENLGDEIYDGLGSTEILRCECDTATSRWEEMDTSQWGRIRPIEPTPKIPRPSPPGNLNFGKLDVPINSKGENLLPFFADDTASPGKSYTYTLFAYNSEEVYSLPVRTNVYVGDRFPIRNCHAEPSDFQVP